MLCMYCCALKYFVVFNFWFVCLFVYFILFVFIIHTLQLGFAEKLLLFVDFKISFRMIWLNRPSFVFDGHRHTLTEWKWLRYNFDDSSSFKAKGWFHITMSGLCGAEQIYSPMCTRCGADGIAAFSSETVNRTVPKIYLCQSVIAHKRFIITEWECIYDESLCKVEQKHQYMWLFGLLFGNPSKWNEMKWLCA